MENFIFCAVLTNISFLLILQAFSVLMIYDKEKENALMFLELLIQRNSRKRTDFVKSVVIFQREHEKLSLQSLLISQKIQGNLTTIKLQTIYKVVNKL